MKQQLIGGRKLTEWNQDWQQLKGGLGKRHDALKNAVGVFRFSLRDEVVYIGCAREHTTGGIDKRLFDFVRKSPSARMHHAGQKIYENRDQLQVDVIVTGTDYQAGSDAFRLNAAFLRQKKPFWNVART